MVNGVENVPTDNFVLFSNEGEEFVVEAKEDAVVLILSGEPIDEPIAAHGPFVMNTRAEIMEELLTILIMVNFGYLAD